MTGKLKAIGVDVFAGGFALGVAKHFEVTHHLENTTYGSAVAMHNFPSTQFHHGFENWPDKKLKADFIFCNPPCAIWSVASGRGGNKWKTDERLELIRNDFSLIEKHRPYAWAWESVTQAYVRGRSFTDDLAMKAHDLGYDVTYLLIDAKYLNTPQSRKRFFFLAHRMPMTWQIPSFLGVQTCGEVLARTKPDPKLNWRAGRKEKFAYLIKKTKQGSTLQDTFNREVPLDKREYGERGQTLGRPGFLYRRLDESKPSPTAIGDSMIHPTENRFLVSNEIAALCGFPKKWKWTAVPPRQVADLIARGVCPPVGEWLARQVSRSIEANSRKKVKKELHLVDFRKSPGYIEKITAAVPLDLPWDEDGDTSQMDLDDEPPKLEVKKPKTKIKQAAKPKKERSHSPSRMERVEFIQSLIPTLPKTLKGPRAGEGSGAYIRRLIMEQRKLTDSQLAAAVHKFFPGRSTTESDVAWNRRKLKLEDYIDIPRYG